MIGIGQEGRLADKAGSRELSDQEPGEICTVDVCSGTIFETRGHPRRVICDADEWQPYEGLSSIECPRG